MFQFPGFASRSDLDDGARAPPGSPIRPPVDRRVCAPPHSFSQLTAAFLASVCPGIPHHALARLTTFNVMKQSTRDPSATRPARRPARRDYE